MPELLNPRMKASEIIFYDGDCTGVYPVNPLDSLVIRSCCLNNNDNEWNYSLTDGSVNNNNKNNQNWVLPVEPLKLIDLVFEAEEDCWKNKHSSWDACRFHYNVGSRILLLISSLGRGKYKPGLSICFIVTYPKPREIFAAAYKDRILHHLVSFYLREVSENTHKALGDKSFGNRPKVSAYHAALKLLTILQKHPNGYVWHFDVKSCFMSINKQKAWEMFCHFDNKYGPKGYDVGYLKLVRALLYKMIMHNPATNCLRRTPESMWKLIPNDKSLFYKDGLPIGNFYAQLIVNLLLAYVWEVIESDGVEFVDDFSGAVDTIELFNKVEKEFTEALSFLCLTPNYLKVYIQKVNNGVKFCGYFVYPNRIYASNRPINKLLRKIDKACKEVNLKTAKYLLSSINSYFGNLGRCYEYNTQKRLVKYILQSPFGKYFYFKKKGNLLVCKLQSKYKNKIKNDIVKFDNYLKQLSYDCNPNKKRK